MERFRYSQAVRPPSRQNVYWLAKYPSTTSTASTAFYTRQPNILAYQLNLSATQHISIEAYADAAQAARSSNSETLEAIIQTTESALRNIEQTLEQQYLLQYNGYKRECAVRYYECQYAQNLCTALPVSKKSVGEFYNVVSNDHTQKVVRFVKNAEQSPANKTACSNSLAYNPVLCVSDLNCISRISDVEQPQTEPKKYTYSASAGFGVSTSPQINTQRIQRIADYITANADQYGTDAYRRLEFSKYTSTAASQPFYSQTEFPESLIAGPGGTASVDRCEQTDSGYAASQCAVQTLANDDFIPIVRYVLLQARGGSNHIFYYPSAQFLQSMNKLSKKQE